MGSCLGLSSRREQEEQQNRDVRNPGNVRPARGGDDVQVQDHLFLKPTPSNLRRRMTAKLWATLDDPEVANDSEDGVEDRVAALRLQEFLKKHKDDMELGLLARAQNASSQFDDRIQKLFEMRRPTGDIIHRKDPTRVHWLKAWVTTPFLLDFLEKNWSHVNFSPFMTLEQVENRLMQDYSAIVVRLSSTIPGFITVSCNAKETQQPIHVRYQVRADLSIRGEQDISYPSFSIFIASFDQNMEGAPRVSFDVEPDLDVPATDAKIAPADDPGAAPSKPAASDDFKKEPSMDPIARIGPQQPHVALYARTSDIRTWVKSEGNAGEGEGEITLHEGRAGRKSEPLGLDVKATDGIQPVATMADMSGMG